MKKELTVEEKVSIISAVGNSGISKTESSGYRVSCALLKAGLKRDAFLVDSGASKMCIIFNDLPYVIKWTYFEGEEDDRYDEAVQEAIIYQKAVEEGVEKFFPYTEILFENNGISFVLQEKVDFQDNEIPYDKYRRYSKISNTVSEKVLKKIQKDINRAAGGRCARCISKIWFSMIVSLYGKKQCKKFCDFLIENKINDLHRSNIGYINNHPVVLDFSGYRRQDY